MARSGACDCCHEPYAVGGAGSGLLLLAMQGWKLVERPEGTMDNPYTLCPRKICQQMADVRRYQLFRSTGMGHEEAEALLEREEAH